MALPARNLTTFPDQVDFCCLPCARHPLALLRVIAETVVRFGILAFSRETVSYWWVRRQRVRLQIDFRGLRYGGGDDSWLDGFFRRRRRSHQDEAVLTQRIFFIHVNGGTYHTFLCVQCQQGLPYTLLMTLAFLGSTAVTFLGRRTRGMP